jgi:hypothetical protein
MKSMARVVRWWVLVMVMAGSVAAGNVEVTLRTFLDPDDTDDANAGILARGGYRVGPSASVGLYGSFLASDRTLPAKTDEIYGLGGFVEVGPATTDFLFVPYAGASLGLIDSSGPNDDTLIHATGSLGLRFPIGDRLAFTVGATGHWADEKFFDERTEGIRRIEGDRTDVTGDLGLTFRF